MNHVLEGYDLWILQSEMSSVQMEVVLDHFALIKSFPGGEFKSWTEASLIELRRG